MMFQPSIALESLIIVFWIESIISGIIWIVFAVQDEGSSERRVLSIISAAQILLWVGLVWFPKGWEIILRIFIIIAWIWAIIKWILLTIDSFKFKKMRYWNWGWILAAWISLIILWLFLASNSLLTILIINGVIGLWMVITGIAMIVLALQIKKTAIEIRDEIEEAIANGDWIEIEVTKVRKF